MKTNYISTFKGNRFYPLEQKIDKIDIEDIAHGLAYQCRFNGQTNQFYSVAQHSVMVAKMVPKHMQLAALLHDASEAYVGDMVKPLKMLLPEYSLIEEAVTNLIADQFSLERGFNAKAEIKLADMTALATEKRDLMPYSNEDWSYLVGFNPLSEIIKPLHPGDAKNAFLNTWNRINNASTSQVLQGMTV
jgi:5'-deoxynucleotidase YfbR-like HD superfamily hydrolase